MKRLVVIMLVLIMCIPCITVAGTLEEDREALEELKIEVEKTHAEEIALEHKAERIATVIVCVINASLCIWGINQKSSYGTVTGLLFGLRFGGNVKDIIDE